MSKKILIIGMMGCGKTTVGKIVARKLKLHYVDIDRYIENKEGKTVSEIFDISESYFRELEYQASVELSKLDNVVVSSGGGIILFERNMECFSEFIKVYINRSKELILSTVNRENRPMLKNGDELFLVQYKKRLPIYLKYKDIEVISDGTPYDCAKKILGGLLKYEKNNGR